MFGWRTFGRPRLTAPPPRPPPVPAPPDDFPRFLGPDGTGVLPAAQIAGDWTTAPPRELWRRQVGAGWSGFAVVGDYAFTQEQREDQECVTCYRVTDGEPVWVHADAARYDGIGGPGPRATPAVADSRVYAVGATGLLNWSSTPTTGTVQWSVNIRRTTTPSRIMHGVWRSLPLVDGDRVLVCPTDPDGPSLVAYHRRSGARLWRAGTDGASFASPMLAELDGARQILLANSVGVAGHAADDGRVLWRFEWVNSEHINASQPVAHAGGPNGVVLATGYGRQKVRPRFDIHRSAAAGRPKRCDLDEPVPESEVHDAGVVSRPPVRPGRRHPGVHRCRDRQAPLEGRPLRTAGRCCWPAIV